jgi:hypothetical protein
MYVLLFENLKEKGSERMASKVDKNLFIYLTKKAGYDLQDVADRWGVGLGAVYKRLNGEVDIRRGEMESWMRLVGVTDAGPIFFGALVAEKLHEQPTAAG